MVLMCGLPGAGKTTVAKALATEVGALRLCPDEWLLDLGFDLFDEPARDRVEKRLWALAEELLTGPAAQAAHATHAAHPTTVILENGFWSRQERDACRLRARALGFEVELRYLAVPSAELQARVAARGREPGEAAIIPEMLTEYQNIFEAPTPAELELFDPPYASPDQRRL